MGSGSFVGTLHCGEVATSGRFFVGTVHTGEVQLQLVLSASHFLFGLLVCSCFISCWCYLSSVDALCMSSSRFIGFALVQTQSSRVSLRGWFPRFRVHIDAERNALRSPSPSKPCFRLGGPSSWEARCRRRGGEAASLIALLLAPGAGHWER